MAITDLEQSIGAAFGDIPAVETVHVLRREEVFTVYTVIDEDDEDTFDQIYERERSIIHRLDGRHFDFNVVARRGRPARDLLSFSEPTWQRDQAC